MIMTQRSGRTQHKKRHGHHQKRSGHFLKVYHPFLPLLVLITGSLLLFSAFGPSQPDKPVKVTSGDNQPSVLAYATSMNSGDLLTYTNQRRAKAKLSNLKVNSRLTKAAQTKANDMANRNYWSHNTPDGTPPWTFISNADYSYSKAGENLACGFNLSKEVIDGWYASLSHRENLLHPDYTEVGFGITDADNYKCGDLSASKRTIIVAMYGTPYTKATTTTKKTTTTNTKTKSTTSTSTAGSSSSSPVTSHNVTVTVSDSTGKPASGVRVKLESSSKTETTGKDGQVVFSNVATGKNVVTLEADGSKSIVDIDLTGMTKDYKLSVIKPELTSNMTSVDGDKTDAVKPSMISKLQLLSNGWAPWIFGFLSVTAVIGLVYMVVKHSLAAHRFIVKGERYILTHKMVDVGVLLLLVALFFLSRTAGAIL